jgi:hypothetical protein
MSDWALMNLEELNMRGFETRVTGTVGGTAA